jgi:uncharacterized protein
MELYLEDIEGGWTGAQYDVGRLYENGLGMPKDLDRAKVCYQRAADDGSEKAKDALRRLGD